MPWSGTPPLTMEDTKLKSIKFIALNGALNTAIDLLEKNTDWVDEIDYLKKLNIRVLEHYLELTKVS